MQWQVALLNLLRITLNGKNCRYPFLVLVLSLTLVERVEICDRFSLKG